MAYINVDEFKRKLIDEKNFFPAIVARALDEMPPADVVPRKEVERLETEVRLLTENSISTKYPCCVSTSNGLILTKSLEEYDKLLGDIASEVAREIFAEIDSTIELVCAMTGVNITIFGKYAELKKKYIGDKK